MLTSENENAGLRMRKVGSYYCGKGDTVDSHSVFLFFPLLTNVRFPGGSIGLVSRGLCSEVKPIILNGV